MKKTNKKGFTIVELVIVIAVIAILAAVLIPTFAGVIEKANKNADLQAARNAFTDYYASLSATELETLDKQVLVYHGSHGYSYVISNGGVETDNTGNPVPYGSKELAETKALAETAEAADGSETWKLNDVEGIANLKILELETTAGN